jgi:hypothetical protein
VESQTKRRERKGGSRDERIEKERRVIDKRSRSTEEEEHQN